MEDIKAWLQCLFQEPRSIRDVRIQKYLDEPFSINDAFNMNEKITNRMVLEDPQILPASSRDYSMSYLYDELAIIAVSPEQNKNNTAVLFSYWLYTTKRNYKK